MPEGAVFGNWQFAAAGGLLSYSPSFAAQFRRAASYVDRILRGARPADLPIERPSRFELVVNMKTAKALGLAIPPSGTGAATRSTGGMSSPGR